MPERSSRLLIVDILDSIKNIETYTANISYDDFIHNRQVSDAVNFNLQVIGEAANRISSEVRDRFNVVKWRRIIGLRNRIVHDYFGINYEMIWKIINKDIPELKYLLEEVLEKLEK